MHNWHRFSHFLITARIHWKYFINGGTLSILLEHSSYIHVYYIQKAKNVVHNGVSKNNIFDISPELSFVYNPWKPCLAEFAGSSFWANFRETPCDWNLWKVTVFQFLSVITKNNRTCRKKCGKIYSKPTIEERKIEKKNSNASSAPCKVIQGAKSIQAG